MNRWGIVGFAHWFVAVGFLTLPPTIITAYGQLFEADWTLPVIGGFLPYELYIEFIAAMTTLGIATLMVIRLLNLPSRPGRKSRFAGSKMGQAYFVEYVILTIGLAIYVLRGLEGALHHVDHFEAAYFASYPLILAFKGLSVATLQNLVYLAAMIKLGTTMIWMITVSLNTNMGVAWHRFLAFPNIWFKREGEGRDGARRPPADDLRRRADRLHRPGRRRRLRRRPGRAVLLEGPARLLHRHGVRALPVAVPRLRAPASRSPPSR
ncbi:hypothetical protein SALBM311S_04937 [Streptomyces alboniger]